MGSRAWYGGGLAREPVFLFREKRSSERESEHRAKKSTRLLSETQKIDFEGGLGRAQQIHHEKAGVVKRPKRGLANDFMAWTAVGTGWKRF